MDITINASFLPHEDPEQSLAFYRDALGFEVRKDIGRNTTRWITIGPAGRPDMNIVLTPPAADPGVTDDERRVIAEMMAKGTYASIMLATTDLDAVFERAQASGADVMQEPTDQPWGSRACALRDPAGTTESRNSVTGGAKHSPESGNSSSRPSPMSSRSGSGEGFRSGTATE